MIHPRADDLLLKIWAEQNIVMSEDGMMISREYWKEVPKAAAELISARKIIGLLRGTRLRLHESGDLIDAFAAHLTQFPEE